MTDAGYADGQERALRLLAQSVEDLTPVSALLQDAVAQTSDISWLAKKHRFALLMNRFRWEDRTRAELGRRPYERVQSMLVIDSALKVSTSGIDPRDKELVLSLLALSFVEGEDGAGKIILTFSGDGQIAVAVECIDLTLKDVSRPYLARAKDAPHHPED